MISSYKRKHWKTFQNDKSAEYLALSGSLDTDILMKVALSENKSDS